MKRSNGSEKKIHFRKRFRSPIESKLIKFESSKTYTEKKDMTRT